VTSLFAAVRSPTSVPCGWDGGLSFFFNESCVRTGKYVFCEQCLMHKGSRWPPVGCLQNLPAHPLPTACLAEPGPGQRRHHRGAGFVLYTESNL